GPVIPGLGHSGESAHLDMAEAELPQALNGLRLLVETSRHAERRREAEPERLDGQRRVRSGEAPDDQPDAGPGDGTDEPEGEIMGGFGIESGENGPEE